MKASSIVSLLVAGLLLVMVSADGEETLNCGRNMVPAGCACNQVCNSEPTPCPLRPCLITPVVCACVDGYCLPNANSNYCVKPDECTTQY